MRRLLLPLLLLTVAATPAFADVAAAVEKALKDAPPKATVAVHVRQLDGDRSRVLFAHQSNQPFIPASNLKLLTTAAALDRLGPDYRFRTRLFVKPTGETTANVLVVGGGDPAFGDPELLETYEGGARLVLDHWAKLLAARGITSIDQLVLDDTVFDQNYDHPNWPEDQKHRWYEAQVAGLNLATNVVDVYLERDASGRMRHRVDPPTNYVTVGGRVKVGSKNEVGLGRVLGTNDIVLSGRTNARQQGPMHVTVHDPTAYFGTVFAEALRDAGVQVVQAVKGRGDPADGWTAVAVHETPIATVLARTNRDSMNLYAESLIKLLGRTVTEQPGSWTSGAAAVKTYLASLGVDTSPIALDDGSGMSRLSTVTAATLTAILQDKFEDDEFELFRDSLSEAGTHGTLRRRFRSNADLHGRVFGKTGFINGVSTMSGYLHGRDGNWYAYSVLVNNCPRSEIWRAKLLQESVVAAIDGAVQPADAVVAR
jgi:D-alanyl-D-alanine carboxypeptidase/D-alanyl-D-alanine-endopeptidase (penicillin-binding protein 4)